MPTLNLDGDFAGPELKGNLFVEHAGNHQAHHLALACGERAIALTQFGKLVVLVSRYAIAIESLLNRIALTVMGISPWPVMKMMGIRTPTSASFT